MGVFVKHIACDDCGSSDGRAIYEDTSSYCWVCTKAKPSEEWLTENGKGKGNKGRKVNTRKDSMNEFEDDKVSNASVKAKVKPAITEEEKTEIKSRTSNKGDNFRGISDKTGNYFGIRYSFDEETGEVTGQYCPCTQDSELVGYHLRTEPKDFRSIGRTGADTELFGAFRFKSGGKYLVLCEGQLDALSAYQMLKEYNESRGNEFEVACVSATIGAQSAKQIANNYTFLNLFSNIIVSYDADKAGKEGMDKLIPKLPKGKVRIMNMRYKDANEYLEKGKSKEFVSDFYNAKSYVPTGVMASDVLYDCLIAQSDVEKIPFPSFLEGLNTLTAGGLPLGHIINICADTSIGKSTLVNEMVYELLFTSPHRVGIVSMEADAAQYAEVLLSRHLSKKLALIANKDEKMAYLKSENVIKASDELFKDSDGNARFHLLENRDASIEEIQNTIEELVVTCGVKLVVLDPLQDLLDGLSIDTQALFMQWSKGFVKTHKISFIYVQHLRKPSSGSSNDAVDEFRVMGSSTIIKSASLNVLLKRDKLAEDDFIKNSTEVWVTKNRLCGLTGLAGVVYYDNATHTLHNRDTWLEENGLSTEF